MWERGAFLLFFYLKSILLVFLGESHEWKRVERVKAVRKGNKKKEKKKGDERGAARSQGRGRQMRRDQQSRG